MVTHSSN